MPAAPLPKNEAERLEVLRSLRVLDSAPERGFDELTELARETLSMPIALVSLVDEQRQWFKSAAGLDACETPRSQSVCAYVVLNERSLVIDDLAADERTSDNELVTGDPGLRFYGGAPIVLSSGEVVGSFCVLDTAPRTLSMVQLGWLERMASACASLLEIRRSAEMLPAADRLAKAVQDAAPVALLHLEPVRDERTRVTDFVITDGNVMAGRLLRMQGQPLGSVPLASCLPELKTCGDGRVFEALRHTMASGDPASVECDYNDGNVNVSMRWKVARLDGRLVCSIEDIGESLRHQREIQARDELLEQFVANTPAAVAMFDNDMRYLVASDQWRRDYGLGDIDLVGMSHYDVFPEIGEAWKAFHRRTLAGETVTSESDRFERADGSVQYLRYQLQPWRDAEGSIGGLIMFTEDITERVVRENELQQVRELSEAAGRLSRVGGWSYDVEDESLTWTSQTREIFGVPEDFEPRMAEAISF
ncbi:MAG: PAS domain-containing protein [Planctomycetota bacterium]